MLERYIDWVFSQALPAWRDRGFDPRRSAFHERLDAAGLPLPVPQRAMVQARQIYVFAHAATLGLLHEGTAMADAAMRTLRQRYGRRDARGLHFVYSLEAGTDAVASSAIDSYTHAFVLLATAFLFRATGDDRLLTMADDVARFIDTQLADPVAGGVVDMLPEAEANPPKRQNPQMHLLEAYLALEEAAPGRGYLARALDLVTLFRTKLLDRPRGVLVEHFDAAWGPHPDSCRGRFFEPGHHYEWAWLLEQTQRLSGVDLIAERRALLASAARSGHAEGGLIFDEVTAGGAVQTRSHRLWPHTEAIKAAATMRRAGEPGARNLADTMAGCLLTTFLDRPFAGGWIDHVEPDLTPRVDYVPASSLYHLFLAAAEGAQPPGNVPGGLANLDLTVTAT